MNERELFNKALELPPHARRQYLIDACRGNSELLSRLLELLKAHELLGSFAEPSAGQIESTVTHSPALAPIATTIEQVNVSDAEGLVIAGRYKLLQKIGEGGMGTVWMAQQSEPVKRKVAVKLIKAGRDAEYVLARFEAERQALAVMDHPNIAKVLDGGLHDNRPFFVMELVKGVPITEYCDQQKLTPKERLELFVPVCNAIQHAHQKGIIHRDIKPSNVLVALYDDKPVPKVIDFGIAKATGGTLTEQTIETAFGGVVGTPQYMSPEQASLNNLDIDTRSDVYSLGVLLYELLTGSPPFARKDLLKAGLLEILRVVREEEPPRPSTKLSTADALPSLSANRGTEPKKLTGLLRNELDWIVMKALEKDRSRRYETANGFAADIQRYLSGEAVQAHPAGVGYRLKKFVRRNRGQVIAGSLLLLALVTGIAGTTFGLLRAEDKRIEAEQARVREKERADGEQKAKDEAIEARGKAELAYEAEKSAKKRVVEFRDKALEALRATTGKDVENLLGEKKDLTANERAYLEAIAERWQAFAKQEGTDEQSQAIRAEGLFRVGSLWARLGRLAESRPVFEQAIVLLEKLETEFPATSSHLISLGSAHTEFGLLLAKSGYRAAAEPHFRKGLSIRKKLASDYPNLSKAQFDLARSHSNLASLMHQVGKNAEAEEECLQAKAIYQKLVADFPEFREFQAALALCHVTLGRIRSGIKKWTEAERDYNQGLFLREKLAKDFPNESSYQLDLADSYINLAHLHLSTKNWADVEKPTRQALSIMEKIAAEYPNNPEYQLNLAKNFDNLGLSLSYLGRLPDSEIAFKQGLVIREKLTSSFSSVPVYKTDLGASYCNLGSMFSRRGQPSESLAWYEKAISTLKPVCVAEPRDIISRQFLRNSHTNRALSLAMLQKYSEALSDWETAIELSPPEQQLKYRVFRAVLLAHIGNVDEAVKEMTTLRKQPGWNPFELYDFACGYSIASGKVPDKQSEYADTAMNLLHQAVKGGVRDIRHMKTDKSMAPLRDRDDFKKLIAELEAKTPKK